ncbi:hypothetical protein DPMN_038405 [Dreissena polymorpha]|uniref:Uncharacterized protein n=1 Tax=Dreissena polymorpha TaxID=45954 RepID=A0A9D4MGW9_DREPO|nr:hypothetical protein DPMN_038405 [Dreissena polymorpha]
MLPLLRLCERYPVVANRDYVLPISIVWEDTDSVKKGLRLYAMPQWNSDVMALHVHGAPRLSVLKRQCTNKNTKHYSGEHAHFHHQTEHRESLVESLHHVSFVN